MEQDFLLVRKMKNGDEAAMDTFVRKYYPQVLRYCRYHCFDTGQAEDLVQETFEKFFKALAGYQHVGKAIHYLYTIARNLCIDYGKKKIEITALNIPESGENPMDEMDIRLDIDRALAKLPDEMREVIILHYFQGLSLKETAVVLQIGVPLAKYRIKRAKEQLKKTLGREEEY